MAQPTPTYRTLRSAYDRAFQRLAREVKQLGRLQDLKSIDGGNTSEARQQVAAAQSSYLEARNALADHLLSAQPKDYVSFAAQDALPDKLDIGSVKERAYFLWENAGKPSGNDQANWYRAEARFFRGESISGCSSR